MGSNISEQEFHGSNTGHRTFLCITCDEPKEDKSLTVVSVLALLRENEDDIHVLQAWCISNSIMVLNL